MIFNDYISSPTDIRYALRKETDRMNREKTQELERAIARDYGNIAGVVAMRGGERVFEAYFNGYSIDNALHVYSVTKSVFSALLGIAVGQGHIESVDRRVLDYFPDYAVPKGEKTIQRVTIKNLLTMTAPYKYETEPYEEFFSSPNPILHALGFLGGEGVIGDFNYSAIGGTHILSGILAKATGQSALAFAAKYLFSPLGIDVPRNVSLRDKEEHLAFMADKASSGWVSDQQGFNTASWGLFLKPRDMAKIGQLYLDKGTWDGDRILPLSWIEESTREQSRCAQRGGLAYGYLWWIIGEGCYAALGDGGNAIYVNSKEGIVIAIASLFMPDAKDRIELIKKLIEPALMT
jgi:CubicO group peptidase (beta-lactamase class C family)